MYVSLLPVSRICVESILARVPGFQVLIFPELFASIDHQNRSKKTRLVRASFFIPIPLLVSSFLIS